MHIKDKENNLFKRWAVVRNDFVADGIIDEKIYSRSNVKLLFVLREVNGKVSRGLDLREFLKDGASSSTWDNITRWTIGLRNLDKEVRWSQLENISDDYRKQILRSICSINLKKSCSESVTDNEQLYEIVNQDKDYLNEQFSLYYPDIIICCGPATCNIFQSQISFKRKLEWNMTDRGIWYCEYDPGKLIIQYYHPQTWIHESLLYYGLIDAVKEIMLRMGIG